MRAVELINRRCRHNRTDADNKTVHYRPKLHAVDGRILPRLSCRDELRPSLSENHPRRAALPVAILFFGFHSLSQVFVGGFFAVFFLGVQFLRQRCFHELIQIAIQHVSGVRGFKAGAQVFDHLVRVNNV